MKVHIKGTAKIYKAYVTWHGDAEEGSLGYFITEKQAQKCVDLYESIGNEYLTSLSSGVREIKIRRLTAEI
jgi:hypothetical protein